VTKPNSGQHATAMHLEQHRIKGIYDVNRFGASQAHVQAHCTRQDNRTTGQQDTGPKSRHGEKPLRHCVPTPIDGLKRKYAAWPIPRSSAIKQSWSNTTEVRRTTLGAERTSDEAHTSLSRKPLELMCSMKNAVTKANREGRILFAWN
jgi:hypothetical protein